MFFFKNNRPWKILVIGRLRMSIATFFFFFLVPSAQCPVTRTYDKTLEARNDHEAALKESRRLSGVAWVAAKRGGLFVGSLPVASANFVYQVEGHRIVACIQSMECIGLMQAFHNIEDQDVDSSMAPEMMVESGLVCFVKVFFWAVGGEGRGWCGAHTTVQLQ